MRDWHPSYSTPLTDCRAAHPEAVTEPHTIMTAVTQVNRRKHPPIADAILLYDRWLRGMRHRRGQVMKTAASAE
jgi:hypothetical protein